MKIFFSIEALYNDKEKQGNVFIKEVEYTSKARSMNSPIILRELEAWIADTEKYFNVSYIKNTASLKPIYEYLNNPIV